MRVTYFFRTIFAATLATAVIVLKAEAATFKTLYSFCEVKGCGNGNGPAGSLVMDQHENIFGVLGGGGYGHGAIYELKHTGKDTWKFKVLYRFCLDPKCLDGENPSNGLIQDVNGNLYGVTAQGGGDGHYGVVFELKNAQGSWQLVVLHDFTDLGNEGGSPSGALTYQGAQDGLPYDGVSPLYGTTQIAGNAAGTAFKLTPSGESWTLETIHSFLGSIDGITPSSGLIPDSAGNLYGATPFGGGNGASPNYSGIVFELSPSGEDWTEKVLYRFCAEQTYCADFEHPIGRLVMDTSGALLGTAPEGGPMCYRHNHCGGGVFKLMNDGDTWTYQAAYAFCGRKKDDVRCPTGKEPDTGLTLNATGNAYGATRSGGLYGGGVVFRLRPDGAYATLHDFCSLQDCADGRIPLAELLADPNGKRLFGTTVAGGANDGGTIFELTP